jgi:hypothetical protein
LLRSRKRRLGAATAVAVASTLVPVGAGVVAATAASAASTQTSQHDCLNSLGAYPPNNSEISPLGISFTAPADPIAPEGEAITLGSAQVRLAVTSEYLLQLYRGREGGNYSLLTVGANQVPYEVWVAVEGTNTVEGTQTVKVSGNLNVTVTDPTPFVDPTTSEPSTTSTNWIGRTSGDEVIEAVTLNVNLPATTWTPTGAGAVEFSEGPAGSISYPEDTVVPPDAPVGTVPQPEGTIRVTGISTHNLNTNPYWVKPYGSVYVRLNTLSNPLRPETGADVNGYGVNLDCVAGTVAVKTPDQGETLPGRSVHGAFEPDTELTGWATKDVDTDGVVTTVTGQELMVNSGSLGRYDIVEQPQAPFAQAVALTGTNHECFNSLGAYIGQEFAAMGIEVGGQDVELGADGKAVLDSATVTLDVPDDYVMQLYRGREGGNYSLLEVGTNAVPFDVWVSIAGSNTVEGTQTVKVSAELPAVVTDPTPFIDPTTSQPATDTTNFLGRTSGDETVTVAPIVVELPVTTWTPTGAGDVAFTEGPAGSISFPEDTEVPADAPQGTVPQPDGTVRITGISTHNLNTNPYWVKPYGSVFVRLNTLSNPLRPETGDNINGYGANLDCVGGELGLATPAEGTTLPGRSVHGAFPPGTELYGWATKVTNGVETTGQELMVNSGSMGRYAVADAPRTPFAVVQSDQVFSDVPSDHPFLADIVWASENGITEGYTDGTFRPASPVTRQAFAAFLYRSVGSPDFTPPATPTFSDVPATHAFYTEIEWAAAQEITEGYEDGTFGPELVVSRQATAAFLYRSAGSTFEDPAIATFSDVDADHPFFSEIEWLVANDVAEGYTDGTFKPGADVSRQAAVAFLHRLPRT